MSSGHTGLLWSIRVKTLHFQGKEHEFDPWRGLKNHMPSGVPKLKKKKKSALHSAVKPSLKKSKSKNIYINILTL